MEKKAYMQVWVQAFQFEYTSFYTIQLVKVWNQDFQ